MSTIEQLNLPPILSTELCDSAFQIGYIPWPAWDGVLALSAIEEMRSHLLAITWLQLGMRTPAGTQTHYTKEEGDFTACGEAAREPDESWPDFVARSCNEAAKLVSELMGEVEMLYPAGPEASTLAFILMWETEEMHEETARQNEIESSDQHSNRPARALDEEVELFRSWADTYEQTYKYGEWECDYSCWVQIVTAFDKFLLEHPFELWDADTIDMLLYIIARDNEIGQLARDLAVNPERLLFLSWASLSSKESDAKWQLAHEIGELTVEPSSVEPLLLAFTNDDYEYVRRRALRSLGQIKSPSLENLAEPMWTTGDEYMRMTVLGALHNIGSDKLTQYLCLADEDGNEYLVAYASEIRAKQAG